MYKTNIIIPNINEIRNKVSDYELFRYYTGVDFILKKPFLSPIREEKNPSFCIYTNGSGLKFKDFGSGHQGSIYDFVMLKYNCIFKKALEIIEKDFKDKFKNIKEGVKIENRYIESLETIIEVKRRKWDSTLDDGYWSLYELKKGIVEYFKIFPITHAWVNKKLVLYPNTIHYAYRRGYGKYRIYSPKSNKKWLGNIGAGYLQGYDQLPETGKLLIITKSLKDVMELYNMDFSAIAPLSETNYISEDKIKELKGRFKRLLTFYDDDAAGNIGAKKLLQYNIPSIKLKRYEGYKDISDFVKANSREEGLKKIRELIIFKGLINYLT